jgi:hypothetical protein
VVSRCESGLSVAWKRGTDCPVGAKGPCGAPILTSLLNVLNVEQSITHWAAAAECAGTTIGPFKVGLILLLIWSLIGIGWEMAISDY